MMKIEHGNGNRECGVLDRVMRKELARQRKGQYQGAMT